MCARAPTRGRVCLAGGADCDFATSSAPIPPEALFLLDPLVAVLEVMQIPVNWAREHGYLVVEGGLL